MTTLGAAGADDSATTTGTHADEEAVGTLATHDGRLVSTFHGRVPNKKSARLQPVSPWFVKLFFVGL
jgi:hypothetical protein